MYLPKWRQAFWRPRHDIFGIGTTVRGATPVITAVFQPRARGFKKQRVAALRDPGSFKHIETRVTPVDANGQHQIMMKYRARNGFGGTNVEQTVGTYSNATCNAVLLGSR